MRRDPDCRRGATPANEPSSFATWTICTRGERARRDAGGGRRERRARASPRPATRATRRRGRGRGRARAARALRARRALPERRAAWPRPRRVRRGAPAGGRSHDSPDDGWSANVTRVPGWEGNDFGHRQISSAATPNARRSSLVAPRRLHPHARSSASLPSCEKRGPPSRRARAARLSPEHPPSAFD